MAVWKRLLKVTNLPVRRTALTSLGNTVLQVILCLNKCLQALLLTDRLRFPKLARPLQIVNNAPINGLLVGMQRGNPLRLFPVTAMLQAVKVVLNPTLTFLLEMFRGQWKPNVNLLLADGAKAKTLVPTANLFTIELAQVKPSPRVLRRRRTWLVTNLRNAVVRLLKPNPPKKAVRQAFVPMLVVGPTLRVVPLTNLTAIRLLVIETAFPIGPPLRKVVNVRLTPLVLGSTNMVAVLRGITPLCSLVLKSNNLPPLFPPLFSNRITKARTFPLLPTTGNLVLGEKLKLGTCLPLRQRLTYP